MKTKNKKKEVRYVRVIQTEMFGKYIDVGWRYVTDITTDRRMKETPKIKNEKLY